jgi:hypothetical protein
VAGDTDGDGKLSAFEAQIVASHASKAYKMPDGSTVQANPDKPLPAAVVQIIKAKAAAPVAIMKATAGDANMHALETVWHQMEADSAATGKHLMYVIHSASVILGTRASVHLVWAAMASGVGSTGIPVDVSRARFLAAAHDWADGRGYDVILN